jgi:hypothetical protein
LAAAVTPEDALTPATRRDCLPMRTGSCSRRF